ncbi:MAG TPA: periplasmic heavy metal sensor [Burkholderiaceae bacterium]|jgi:Spy/CpxP family protein refolding chaperone|nr:periplasmic heavy metal sensor [Burkholderiaceae bacterium]
MNRPVWKWLLAVSLALNVGIVTAIVVKQVRTAPPATGTPAPHVNLPDYLKLTTDQRQRWHQAEQGFLQDIDVNWREIGKHRESLVRRIFSDKPDRAAIDAEQASIAALQDAQQRRVIAQLLAERELLDAQQRHALMTLLLNRYVHEATEEELLHR